MIKLKRYRNERRHWRRDDQHRTPLSLTQRTAELVPAPELKAGGSDRFVPQTRLKKRRLKKSKLIIFIIKAS